MAKRFLFMLLISLISIVLLAGSTGAQGDGSLPTLDDLELDAWNSIEPGGDTVCSNDTPYIFYTRPTESDDLLIYFNGGGACWFGQTCDLNASPTYVPFAEMDANNPAALAAGIFDLENPENPFLDYNMVFVSYCTGDVHIGDATVTYEVPATEDTEAHEVTIHHNGYNNSTAVLDWTFDTFENPERVFVAGSSAGAIPSPLYTSMVAEAYPDAEIAQLGDGAGGYRAEARTQVLDTWGTFDILPGDYDEYEPEEITFELFYIISGNQRPDITFAQYNTIADETQYNFLALLGEADAVLADLLKANFEDIRAEVDNFHVYTAGGELHTILRRPEFYTYQVNDVRIRDWVASLAAGEAVEDVICEGEACEVVNLYEGG